MKSLGQGHSTRHSDGGIIISSPGCIYFCLFNSNVPGSCSWVPSEELLGRKHLEENLVLTGKTRGLCPASQPCSLFRHTLLNILSSTDKTQSRAVFLQQTPRITYYPVQGSLPKSGIFPIKQIIQGNLVA